MEGRIVRGLAEAMRHRTEPQHHAATRDVDGRVGPAGPYIEEATSVSFNASKLQGPEVRPELRAIAETPRARPPSTWR